MNKKNINNTQYDKLFHQGKILFAPIQKQEEKFYRPIDLKISNNGQYVALIYQVQHSVQYLQIWDIRNNETIHNSLYSTYMGRQIKIEFSGNDKVLVINDRDRLEKCALISFFEINTQTWSEVRIIDWDSLILSELAVNYKGEKCVVFQYDFMYLINNKKSINMIKNRRGGDIIIQFSMFYDNFYIYQKRAIELEQYSSLKDQETKLISTHFRFHQINSILEISQKRQILINCQYKMSNREYVYLMNLPNFGIIRKISIQQGLQNYLSSSYTVLQINYQPKDEIDYFLKFQETYQEIQSKLIMVFPEVKYFDFFILMEQNSFIRVSGQNLFQLIRDRIEIYSFGINQ